MAKEQERIQKGILGDINPQPSGRARDESDERKREYDEEQEPTGGGSQSDRTRHEGSRSVTEGVTGGLGTETGGSRNYRSGTGATGGDIGNRPE